VTDLTKIIQSAIKSNKIIIGYRESIKFIKTNSPKMIIIAKDAPEKIRKEIEDNAKIFEIEVKIFEGSCKDLGTICGKPFPVTTLAIKG
jgi:large subunit ribosomal protein L30e